jgi:hypothetical protein
MRSTPRFAARPVLLALMLAASSCSSSARPATDPSASGPAPSSSPSPATQAPSTASAAGAVADPEDPTESADPIPMTVELSPPFDRSTFPKKTANDKTCWQTLALTGDARKDYDALAASCGGPAGLVEYAKPVQGHLHSVKDKRDTFTLRLQKGLCYRYFAVGDSGIKDLDILVEKRNGALVADDKQTSPVAIIESEKTWCMNEEAEYDFHIEVDGEGSGKYVFGVWARPN